jgi:hypothetical protein
MQELGPVELIQGALSTMSRLPLLGSQLMPLSL